MAFSTPIAESKTLVDVETLLDASVKLAWREIRQRVRLIKRYGRVGCIRGDESRLGQVFFALLTHAVRALEAPDAHEAEIVVTTRLDGARVIVDVADVGAGTEARHPGEFEARTTEAGPVLGLEQCREIVQAHGGTISFESEPGRGGRARVIFPATKGTPVPAPSAPEPMSTTRARILVIDDEPMLGQTLGFAFSGRHDVVVTSSGREALDLLARDSRFDLVLCDLMMPDVTGQKVFQTVEREYPALVESFVFMTGGAFTDTAQAFLESHPGRRLEKPFTILEIERLLA